MMVHELTRQELDALPVGAIVVPTDAERGTEVIKVLHPRHAEVSFTSTEDVIAYMDEMEFGAEYSDGVQAWMDGIAPTHEIDTGDRVDVWTRGAHAAWAGGAR